MGRKGRQEETHQADLKRHNKKVNRLVRLSTDLWGAQLDRREGKLDMQGQEASLSKLPFLPLF